MIGSEERAQTVPTARRLPAHERRRQLLGIAMSIVRNEGADTLTLGHLATRASVSKPVVYDHFATRSLLLIELYRWIDAERVKDFREALNDVEHTAEEVADALAIAYIDCAADTQGEFFAIGAALAGSQEKAAVYQELLDNYVEMFAEVLAAHSTADRVDLERRCIGLVGAGEALSSAVIGGRIDDRGAAATLAVLIRGAIAPTSPSTPGRGGGA